ncbi:MAG TPA: gas vesicle protein [Gemmatimonadaceae bacterium]|nr:gas vesicle protein [Gemmatimonadaceae bacterium]
MTDQPHDDELEDELVLGDLLNHVLNKGVVITGDVTISIADIDLIRVGLSVLLSSVETEERKLRAGTPGEERNGDVSVLPAPGEP